MMLNVNNYYPTNENFLLPTEKLSDLPIDLLKEIFFDLSETDLQCLVCVNTSLNNCIQKMVGDSEADSIKKFIFSFMGELKDKGYQEQIALLKEVIKNSTFEKQVTLPLVKQNILKIKVDLISIIKTLGIDTINSLKNRLRFPHFMQNIFVLSALEAKIDTVDLLAKSLKINVLCDTCLSLMRINTLDTSIKKMYTCIDRAIFAVTENFAIPEKAKILTETCHNLLQAGNSDTAIIVASLIPEESTKQQALSLIRKHANNGMC